MVNNREDTPARHAAVHKFRVPVRLREILAEFCQRLEAGEDVDADVLYEKLKPWT